MAASRGFSARSRSAAPAARSSIAPDGGGIVIAPMPTAPTFAPELSRRRRSAAGPRVAARPPTVCNIEEQVRLRVGGAGGTRSPCHPCGSRAGSSRSSCPEAEFLAQIDRTIRMLAIGLARSRSSRPACLVAIGARRFLADPVARIAGPLGYIERFQLEAVPYRPSRLAEIDRLSRALARMAAGLADFAKFIPTELVRTPARQRLRAEPGGERSRSPSCSPTWPASPA